MKLLDFQYKLALNDGKKYDLNHSSSIRDIASSYLNYQAVIWTARSQTQSRSIPHILTRPKQGNIEKGNALTAFRLLIDNSIMKHRKMYQNWSSAKVKKQLLDNFFRRNICHYCYYICKKTSCQGNFNKSTLVKNVGSCIFSECNVTKSNHRNHEIS